MVIPIVFLSPAYPGTGMMPKINGFENTTLPNHAPLI
jgi:hypothetical protein